MEQPSRLLTRPAPPAKHRARIVHRKLPLDLYELEPESGEDEDVDVDLDVDQMED